jgi:hypothetical protein
MSTHTHRIFDTFNRRIVSSHRSLRTAVIAASKFQRRVRRSNGPNSYIPTRIEYLTQDDDPQWLAVPFDEIHDAEYAAGIR